MSDTAFDAFYEKLVLRDFFGKIIPGLFVLVAAVTPHIESLEAWADLSLWSWLYLAGAGWILGFAAQWMGELTSIVRCYPRALEFRDWFMILAEDDQLRNLSGDRSWGRRSPEAGDRNWRKLDRDFKHVATSLQRQGCERYAVIKEACGNGCVCLLLATIMWFANSLIEKKSEFLQVGTTWSTVGLSLILALALWRMHRIHVDRQFKHMITVVEPKQEDLKSQFYRKTAVDA